MTTTAPATTRSRSGWLRTIVLTVGIALLGLTLLPPAAGAETNHSSVHDNSVFQALLCEAGGGKAQIDTYRNGAGEHSSQVTCKGGIYDGMYCYNDAAGTLCSGAFPHPAAVEPGSKPSRAHLWQLGEVIPILESGSLTQIEQLVADVEVAYAVQSDTGADMTRSDDRPQEQDTHHTTHKHGKHGTPGTSGKHGGKHRR